MTTNIILRAIDLTRRYGDITAVERLSFDVRRGETLGFLGPNGAGKTTTLRILCGLLRADEGRVEIDGRPLDPSAAATRHLVGVSPQTITIWDQLTCREQLELTGALYGLTRGDAKRRAGELLATFGLEEKARRLGRTLSGGLARRLNIALALVHRPTVVFLDEPQAGLDPQSRVLVRDYLRSLRGHTTIVVTTHDMEEAEKLSDRVCIIDHGRVLALDGVDAIKRRAGDGDLVEMEVAHDAGADLRALVDRLRPSVPSIAAGDGVVRFVTTDAARDLPDALAAVRGAGWVVRRLATRPRTLEDVFIELTGRGLRE